MDLLDFNGEDMYFDRPLPAPVAALIAAAAEHYASDGDNAVAEDCLLRAYHLAPTHLSVLVSMYRFYYYRQRYPEALLAADRAIAAAAAELGLTADWRRLVASDLGRAVTQSMTLTRFLLLALKGAGFLLMRMDQPAAALERLEKAALFDEANRLGLRDLLTWARTASARAEIGEHGGNVQFIGR